MRAYAKLAQFGDVAGSMFGTEQLGMLLHSVVMMQRPKGIVELGTGLGTCALWMGLGVKRNGIGHIWSVDDLELLDTNPELLASLTKCLHEIGFLPDSTMPKCGEDYYDAISEAVDVRDTLSFIHNRMDLTDLRHFDSYPFPEEIDLLVSDFRHGPVDILSLLGQFLPRMAAVSSIFIDSAPTAIASYLLLRELARLLNKGLVPPALQEYCTVDLAPIVRQLRVTIVHITEQAKLEQNSTAWIKLEPIDVFPHPRAEMRGL